MGNYTIYYKPSWGMMVGDMQDGIIEKHGKIGQ